jgi:hypothetical protein
LASYSDILQIEASASSKGDFAITSSANFAIQPHGSSAWSDMEIGPLHRPKKDEQRISFDNSMSTASTLNRPLKHRHK